MQVTYNVCGLDFTKKQMATLVKGLTTGEKFTKNEVDKAEITILRHSLATIKKQYFGV